MFLDHAVEPFYYQRGHDFYQDGQNHAMAPLLYHVGPILYGEQGFAHLLATFQHAIRVKSTQAVMEMIRTIRQVNWAELFEIFSPLAQFAAPECIADIVSPDVNTDAATVVLYLLISRMEVIAAGQYRVEHDQSKNLQTYHRLLRGYIEHDASITFHQTKITNISFPLKLCSVTQVDSKSSPAVQLADIMIGATLGAMNTLLGNKNPGVAPEAVLDLFSGFELITLLPSLDFEENKRFRRDTQTSTVIDYFSRNFHK